MNRVAALVDSALRHAWAFDELPWHLEVDPERDRFPQESFFAEGLRSFGAMSAAQRRSFVFRETCFHLSNLLAGERSGEQLVAQVMVLTARERPTHREFLAVMAQEEAKHYLALHRYLSEKAGVLYPACQQLRSALDAITRWKFRPGTLNGNPVRVVFTLTVRFVIRAPEETVERASAAPAN